MTLMGLECNDVEARMRSLLGQLHDESAVLDRVVYKNKNQHRHSPYFQALLKVRRDVRLLESAGLGELLNTVFPIIEGRKPAEKAHISKRLKKKYPGGKYNYKERLLGIARLLSQMTEPMIKAATQISFLLAKSFFIGFSVMVLALIARLRVLVQQVLLDVVYVFNKVSPISEKKHSVKLCPAGVEAFREYYPSTPSTADILVLECTWEKDKFVLLERREKTDTIMQDTDEKALPLETPIQYETIELFDEVQHAHHNLGSKKLATDCPIKDSTPLDTQHASRSAIVQSRTATGSVNTEDSEDRSHLVGQKLHAMKSQSGRDSDAHVVSVSYSSRPLELERESKKKVAFVPIRKLSPSQTSENEVSKKRRLESPSGKGLETIDDFVNLLTAGITKKSLF